jgi:ABC-type dipeptide/oligopeptide/nickel transport system ATPase component
MKDLSRRLNIALIVITHNLGVVARYADRVNVMYAAPSSSKAPPTMSSCVRCIPTPWA